MRDEIYELAHLTQGATTTDNYSYDGAGNRLSFARDASAQPHSVELATQFFGTEYLGPTPYSSCLCWSTRLRHEFVKFILWKGIAGDHFLYSESDKRELRCKQHVELGGNRGDLHCHHAGDIHVHIGQRFHEREPNRDDHLHANSDQRRWLGHLYGHRYCKHIGQANDQFIHG